MTMAATNMPTAPLRLPRGSWNKLSEKLRKGIQATFPILGDALDNRTAIGKDYAVQLWQEYHE
jgi:hypothetical protein